MLTDLVLDFGAQAVRYDLKCQQLGFWFAQQGSIYVFVALIFYYAKKMGEIDANSK